MYNEVNDFDYMEMIWNFIKRNIFSIILIVTLLVAMPWLGYIIAIPILFILIFGLILAWRVYRLRQAMNEELRRQQGGYNQRGGARAEQREGEIRVVQTEPTEQKISDDVGEYVDFKEVKEDSTKQ